MGGKQRETANWGHKEMEKKKRAKATVAKDQPLSRTETVSVRLDPQIRYFAELAARKQRRSLSNFIEWAIVQSFHDISLAPERDNKNAENSPTIVDDMYDSTLWSYDRTARLALLAIHYPELLTHDEQALWEIVNKAALLHQARNPDGSLNKEIAEKKCLTGICDLMPFLQDLYQNKPDELNAWIAKIKKWVLETDGETFFFDWNKTS